MKKNYYIKPSMQTVTTLIETPFAGSNDVMQSGGSAGVTLNYGGDDDIGIECDSKSRNESDDFGW